MFVNSLQITKIEQNMSDFWQIVRKKDYFNFSAFVGFIVWIIRGDVWDRTLDLLNTGSVH